MRKRIEALLLGKLERVTPGLPCGGGISTASPAYPPAASDERRSHAAMNCNGKYSDGRCGEPRNGCPHSGTCSFRRPSALRKRRRPANRESLRNIRSEVFYGIDMQERSSLPRTLRQPVACSDSENRRSVKQGMAASFFSGPKAGFRFLSARAASVLRCAARPVQGSCGG